MKKSPWFKHSKNVFNLIAINLVITLISLESLSLAFYFIKEKKFFYTRGKSQGQEKIVADLERTGVRLNESIVERLHPFFGYVLKQGAFARPELGLKVNNFGFFSRYDYPFVRKNKNQFIIGLFGGSVANNFAGYEYVNQGLSNALKKYPEFANKEIVLLNFGNGGYKQPQQLLILNYFLSLGQELDMVINIDGFNEVAMSNLNNKSQVDVTMPSFQHIQPLTGLANNSLSPEMMSSIVNIQQTKKQLQEAISSLENCSFALCYTMRSVQVKQLINRYEREVISYDKQRTQQANQSGDANAIIYINKTQSVLDNATAFAKIASNWSESSIAMNQILTARKIKYFHFIQPNQYYSTKRVFTEEEKRIAISPDSPYAEGVKQGYPILLSKMDTLQNAKVNVFSAVNILDNTQATVYKDGCCHYNSTGEGILANYISSSIIQGLKQSK